MFPPSPVGIGGKGLKKIKKKNKKIPPPGYFYFLFFQLRKHAPLVLHRKKEDPHSNILPRRGNPKRLPKISNLITSSE